MKIKSKINFLDTFLVFAIIFFLLILGKTRRWKIQKGRINEIIQLLTTLGPAIIYIHKDCLLNVNTIIMAITLNITYKVY